MNAIGPLLFILLGAFLLSRQSKAATGSAQLPATYQDAGPNAENLMDVIRRATGEAEFYYELPNGILLSMAGIESGFDPDVIYCRREGAAGERGLMQISPRWHPDANACDPEDAIWYAAGYLRENYDRFGNWRAAVAAYNWGPTNLATYGYDAMPAITWQYVARVGREIGI